MRRLAFVGVMMMLGLIGGALVVSGSHLLGAFMGMVVGAAAAVIVLSFPRSHDYSDDDFWFKD